MNNLVQSDGLELTDLQGNRLVIPKNGLRVDVDPVQEEENTQTAVIIACVIGAIVLAAIVLVIAAVIIKNKKRSKVSSSSSDRGQQNTYNSFQFENVMDGTAASLEKYKSSRLMDDSDRYLAETMRANSGNAMRRASVPKPARYSTPTREELDATQPAPDSLTGKLEIQSV